MSAGTIRRRFGEPARVVHVYPYTDERGNRLFEKLRYEPKDFRYGRNGTPTSKPHNADRYLYRLPELLAGIADGRLVHWCEGEKDADALVDVGQVATSGHQGAGKPHIVRQQAAWFANATHVWVWMDKDEDLSVGAFDAAIRANALLQVAGLLPAQVEIVCARGRHNKDAYDHIAAGFSPIEPRVLPDEQVERWAQRYEPAYARRAGYR